MSSSTTASFDDHTTGEEVVATYSGRVAGKTFLITGPSEKGIGGATVLALATAKPHTIILVGRSPISLATVATKVSAIDASIRVHISLIDFTSLQTVRYGATMLLNDTRIRRIDAIINNAAVCSSEHGRTVDGLETHFQVNAVAPFLLTNLLMPKLVKSAEARVVNVTDSAYADAHRDFADYDSLPINFDPLVDGYAQSKLSNVYFTLSLGRRFRSDGLRAFSVDPGTVFGTQVAVGKCVCWDVATKTAEQACASILFAALDTSLPQGAYVADCGVVQPEKAARDLKKAEALWEICEKIVGQQFGQRKDWCIFGV